MNSSATARHNMVEGQLRTNKVRHPALIAALETLPRERFVPADKLSLAYMDEDIPVDGGRYLMEPLTLARLMEAAHIAPTYHVLDIGPATGYSTALLSRLAAQVTAVEQNATLAAHAREALASLEITNAHIVTGDMAQGHASQAPYDVIFINGAVDFVPPALFSQLKDGGRLVAVVRSSKGMGRAVLHTKTGPSITTLTLFEAGVHPLPGFQKKQDFVW